MTTTELIVLIFGIFIAVSIGKGISQAIMDCKKEQKTGDELEALLNQDIEGNCDE